MAGVGELAEWQQQHIHCRRNMHDQRDVAHNSWRTSNFINSFQTERAIAILNALGFVKKQLGQFIRHAPRSVFLSGIQSDD